MYLNVLQMYVFSHNPGKSIITFYNGTQKEPPWQILKLSDLYETEGEQIDENSWVGKIGESLEVKVLILNINKGNNEELMKVCAPLREYTECIETVREEKRKGRSTREGIVEMLNTMQKTDSIYAKIQKRRAEVETMLETEFNLKEYGETLKKEGKEEGRVIGKQEQAIETCKRMLANPVYTLQMIQELTGFTEEEIQKIQKEFKDK